MFCQKCGQRNIEDAAFCASCGTKLAAVAEASPQSSSSAPQSAANPYEPPLSTARSAYTAPAFAGSYAGFWRRAAALIVDTIFLMIVFALLGIGAALSGQDERSAESMLNFLAFFGQWAYFAGMESSRRGATLGKMLLGIKVVDLQGNKISFGRASGRYFGKIVSALTLFIGYLMAAFTRSSQALHDKIASCLVVTSDTTPEAIQNLDAPKQIGGWALTVLIVAGLGVPILGILAAVAIPAYQDYTAKAQAAEAYTLLAEARNQYINSNQKADFNVASSCLDLLYPNVPRSGRYVAAVVIHPHDLDLNDPKPIEACEITVRFKTDGISTQLAGKKVWMVYDGRTGEWECGSNLPQAIRKKSCAGS